MSGLAQVLQMSFTDTSLPVIDLTDRVLTAGSLLLIEPNHSSNPWAAGVPANNAQLPNIAWQRAKAIIGAGDALSLGAVFVNNAQAADALFERTPKGGLHGIYSQVNNTNANRGALVQAGATIRDYVYNNRAHRFYFSLWSRRTRLAQTAGNTKFPRNVSVSDSAVFSNRMFGVDPAGLFANGGTGSRLTAGGTNVLGNQMLSADASNFSNAPTSNAATLVGVQTWGNFGSGTTAWANVSASDVFYRAYLEDLTVSGRSYAVVDALDFAQWQAAFAVGGRYNGDTFTDPATFP